MASNRFIVDLGDLKVSDAASKQLANGIQRLALEELANTDRAGDTIGVHFPPGWRGLVASVFDPGLPGEFKRLDEELAKVANR